MRTYKPKAKQDKEARRNTRRTDLEALTKSTDERIRLDALTALEAMDEADRKRQGRQERAQKRAQTAPSRFTQPEPDSPEWLRQEAAAEAMLAELDEWKRTPIHYLCGVCGAETTNPPHGRRCEKHLEVK